MDHYAAGLIDGEGYIGIQASGGSYQVRLKVSMADKGLPAMRRMHTKYGGRMYLDRPAKGNDREKHTWVMTGAAASAVVRALRPAFLVKCGAADVALDFQRMVDGAPRLPNGRAKWSEEMRQKAELYKARIQEANRRGPDPKLPDMTPTAIYQGGAWWEPNDGLFGPVPFEGKWPKTGMMRSGRIYPMSAPATGGSGSSSPTFYQRRE